MSLGQQARSCAALTHRWLVLLSAVVLAGCAAPSHPPAPLKAAGGDYQYIIGPLDTLAITVWRNPELTTTATVRPDGRISAPLVGDVTAQGLTPDQLSRELEKALAKYLIEPSVTVSVGGFQGQYSEQVRVIGEAAKPQSVQYRKNMTVLDVMILVGGLTEFADGNKTVLVRGSEGGKHYSLRLRDLIRNGDVSANAEVRPGDVIIIPQGWL
jgi:polysaccharide export outer membrane protein